MNRAVQTFIPNPRTKKNVSFNLDELESYESHDVIQSFLFREMVRSPKLFKRFKVFIECKPFDKPYNLKRVDIAAYDRASNKLTMIVEIHGQRGNFARCKYHMGDVPIYHICSIKEAKELLKFFEKHTSPIQMVAALYASCTGTNEKGSYSRIKE